ncbi:MAG: hypothetical protein LPJ89_04015 [Hymenobacteraceae bacterium]|nr:hypothetical protein [Hymenobacteraceae bacterium]MDX5397204.1 hypothetical protein [Hymenobacteraceae bacterium]MDX5442930.1 hypothetical protein [Hymenobacteraceae bacterium]MDX5513280.1 hypothetical protein [Hymenobacteraceae bacterium]
MHIPIIYASFGADAVGGDMKDRYGPNFEAGAGFLFKTKTNWLFGADFNYLFGDIVKEGILDSILTSDGQLIGSDGLYSDVRVTERGIKLPVLKAGKLVSAPFFNGSVNSGFFGLVGVGFLQHKINFEDVTQTAKQIGGDYRKGYDRLTNGLVLTQTAGYLYLDKKRLINFFIAAEFSQGFTKSRRDFDFSTMQHDDKARKDLFYGVKVGWAFPIYKKLPQTYYYN